MKLDYILTFEHVQNICTNINLKNIFFIQFDKEYFYMVKSKKKRSKRKDTKNSENDKNVIVNNNAFDQIIDNFKKVSHSTYLIRSSLDTIKKSRDLLENRKNPDKHKYIDVKD